MVRRAADKYLVDADYLAAEEDEDIEAPIPRDIALDDIPGEEDIFYAEDEPVDDVLEDLDELLAAPADEDEALADILDADIEDVEIEDNRNTEDFDFAALVNGFSTVDIEGCVAALESEKAAFVHAYRREGRKGSAVAEFYNVANTPIFRRRQAIQAQISKLESMKRLNDNRKYELVRARQQLEYITELLVRFNYGMTRSYVRKFTSNTSPEDSADFQGAANVGLMHAISTFDPDRGRFGSWSFKPIQRAVLKAVQQADFSNMTGGDFERRPHILRAQSKLAGANGENSPTHEQVAEEAGVTLALVKRVLAAPHVDSLHAKVGSEDTAELGDLIADDAMPLEDSIIADMEIHTLINYGLPVLEPREKYVLVCRYGIHGETPEALSDIGRRLNLSREAVRQIAGKALARLSHPMVMGALVRGGRR